MRENLEDIDLGKIGAPDRNRTCNLLIRSQVLYPIELRAQNTSMISRGWNTSLSPLYRSVQLYVNLPAKKFVTEKLTYHRPPHKYPMTQALYVLDYERLFPHLHPKLLTGQDIHNGCFSKVLNRDS